MREKYVPTGRLLNRVLSTFFLVPVSLSAAATGPVCESDLCVYGGTSSGVIAAVQAATMGKSVVLIQPGNHLGGMTSGGLGFVDVGRPESVGGLAREFFHRVWKHYQADSAWKWEHRVELRGQHRPLPPDEKTLWLVEPSAASKAFDAMLAEAKATVVRGESLDRKHGVRKQGSRILSLTMESGRVFAAKMYIDATYEGDLMAAAGVSYFIGREANSRYGEQMNGIRSMADRAVKLRIDPYKVKGDPQSGLLPRVHPDLGGKDFEEDRGVQAYCYRLCLTDLPENRVMIQKPAGYTEVDYELLFRYLEQGPEKDSFITLSRLPNRKTDSNNNGPFSTDYIGMSWDWAEADYATRASIARDHEKWQRGLLWTLQNHPRVPAEIRTYYAPWGLAKDEFTDNRNWPPQLYVREARRMVSDVVITESMAAGREPQPQDGVGLGSYAFDSHAIKYYIDADTGFVTTDGGLSRPPWPRRPPHPYPISYRSIVPKRAECENLLVPVCLSATHVAYGSIRMEPVFMVLGQSAATAAALAIDQQTTVQNLPYPLLRDRLLADHQILTWSHSPPLDDAVALLGTNLLVLASHQIVADTDYWRQHAVPGGHCDGERVSELIIRAAGKFQPAASLEAAVGILNRERIITSSAYWTRNATPGAHCAGMNVATLISNLANRLQAPTPSGFFPTAPAQTNLSWSLVWADEFTQPDGTSPDPAKWDFNIGTGNNGWGNFESQYYTSRTNNARIENDQLVIEALAENFGGRKFTSARLLTKGKGAWTYGRFEARIKLPRGQGMWPAFWMLGTNIDAVGWPKCGEIDIMENIGREPTLVHGTIHGPGYSGAKSKGGSYSLPDGSAFADDFHLYAVEWTTNQIKWYVDSHNYFSVAPNNLPPGAAWVFDQPHYLLLNLAAGGRWPGRPDASTVFPQHMVVDYVRVYAPTNIPGYSNPNRHR